MSDISREHALNIAIGTFLIAMCIITCMLLPAYLLWEVALEAWLVGIALASVLAAAIGAYSLLHFTHEYRMYLYSVQFMPAESTQQAPVMPQRARSTLLKCADGALRACIVRLDAQQVRALAEKHFGKIPRKAVPVTRPQEEPPQRGISG